MTRDDRDDTLRHLIHLALRESYKFNVVILQPMLPFTEMGSIDVFIVLDFCGDPGPLVLGVTRIWWITCDDQDRLLLDRLRRLDLGGDGWK
jgi:hypothetical protein